MQREIKSKMADGGSPLHSEKCPISINNIIQNIEVNEGEDSLTSLFRDLNSILHTCSLIYLNSLLIQNDLYNSDTVKPYKLNCIKRKLYQYILQQKSTTLKTNQDKLQSVDRLFNSELQHSDQTKLQPDAEFVRKSLDIILMKYIHQTSNHPFSQNIVINALSEHYIPRFRNPCRNSLSEQRWKIYRCGPISLEDGCCCACTSEAMYEVMKGLYDCYKSKNCDDCDCILCGQYMIEIIDQAAKEKLKQENLGSCVSTVKGKLHVDKEKLFKDLAMIGIRLPEGNTTSEIEIIKKVRFAVGLPPTPMTAEDNEKEKKAAEAGILAPLEGKTPAEKEYILRQQAQMGITLPNGRTLSEKALIEKITGNVPVRMPERLQEAKAADLLTHLRSKTPEQKENILRGLAISGLPLPQSSTASEKKLFGKVRISLGLPPEPRTAAEKHKYNAGIANGMITPLEGKPVEVKEKILKTLNAAGIPLPEGRTPSEKSIIAKIKVGPTPPNTIASSRHPRSSEKSAFEGETLKPQEDTIEIYDKLKMALAAGLLTPLDGKTPAEKENILKNIALIGLPLPKAQTPSEKFMLDKVRKDVGLPPEPQTAAEKEKYRRAIAGGFFTPLEGKSRDQKEKILKALDAAGITLPEGRTPSEKMLITNIRGAPTPIRVAEKLRQAKAAGLLTPLAGKTPEQKKHILLGLALQGLPLPDGTTPSEKSLIEKIRYDIGLPPKPEKPEDKRKYDKAFVAGLIVPLAGKTLKEKEKTLRAQQALGLELPEGRTDSEKELIDRITELENVPFFTGASVPVNKLKAAKAAGLLTPLHVPMTPDQKEAILKNIAMKDLPLPIGKTDSEKEMINKVRHDVGLPPEPESLADQDKYNKGISIGIVTPLEGKTKEQKEKILRALDAVGIQLPEGRTPSEISLIAEISGKPLPRISERLRKAKIVGLLTPIGGKTPSQKERILRGLAMQGLPLPEASTPSENELIEKVRDDLGLPPKPTSLAQKIRYKKALAAGIITPLEGKPHELKEKILKAQHAIGIPLLEGRTPSEKALVKQIKALSAPPFQPDVAIPIDKLKAAKAAGLLGSIKGKTPEEKEKNLRFIALHGLPLPVGKTPSEKDMIDKVRNEVGLPPEPETAADRERYDKGIAVGIIVPLEGKPKEIKEKILRSMHAAGFPLPVGRTDSEKSLIGKISGQPQSVIPEKLLRARAAGLFAPMTGKTPEQKEKILRRLATKGLPLPDGTTYADKKLLKKVRNDLGLPPEPKTVEEKKRYNKAIEAGLIVPLEGKHPDLKEKILRAQHAAGIPLTKGRTPSERALIAKITGIPPPLEEPRNGLSLHSQSASEKAMRTKIKENLRKKMSAPVHSISGKMRKAKAAGLLTPLQGKSPSEKKRIVKGLAEVGLPMPVDTTPSEKSLFRKIKAHALGANTLPEKEIMKAAQEIGLITSLKGKTAAQKKKIIIGLATAGLPLPEGSTPSERGIIKRIRQDYSLPPGPTDKRGITSKTKKIGTLRPKINMRGIGAAGITSELEEITKTTTCDQSCGCETKKIKFKHSYLKIKVTSPDISNTCPCPEDCFPRPKSEIVPDNEGLKVTIGSAVGIPSFIKKTYAYNKNFTYTNRSDNIVKYHENRNEKGTITEKFQSSVDKTLNYLTKNSCYLTSSSNDDLTASSNYFYFKNYGEDESNPRFHRRMRDHRQVQNEDNNYIQCVYDTCSSQSITSIESKTSSKSSLKSIIVINTDAPDDVLASSNLDIATVSIISIVESIYSSTVSSDLSSGHGLAINDSELSTTQFSSGITDSLSTHHVTTRLAKEKSNTLKDVPIWNRYVFTCRMSQTGFSKNEKYKSLSSIRSSIKAKSDTDQSTSTMDVGNKLHLKKSLSEGSSIFLVFTTSDEFDSDHSLNDTINATDTNTDNPICMQLVSQVSWIKRKSKKDGSRPSTSKDEKKEKKGKEKKEKKRKLSRSKSVSEKHLAKGSLRKSLKFDDDTTTKYYVERSETLDDGIVYRAVSIDTMQDRPCCCTPKKVDIGNSQCSVMISDIFTPLRVDQGFDQEDQQNLRVTSTSVMSPHQTSFTSKRQSPINLSVCHIPPCNRPPQHVVDKSTGGLIPPCMPFEMYGGCHPERDKILDLLEQLGKEYAGHYEPVCKEGAPCCPQPPLMPGALMAGIPRAVSPEAAWAEAGRAIAAGLGAPDIGAVGIGAGRIGAAGIGVPKARVAKAGAMKAGAVKVGAAKSGAAKAGAAKAGEEKPGPEKAVSGKAVSGKAASGKAASGKAATGKAASVKPGEEKAPSGKPGAEKTASGKAEAEKTVSGKAVSGKAVSGKAASVKAGVEQAVEGAIAEGEKIAEGLNAEIKEIIKKPWRPGEPVNQTCDSCGRPVDGKVKCLCSGEDPMKKIRKQLCPCTAYTAPPVPEEPPEQEPEEVEEEEEEEPEIDIFDENGKKICKCCVCEGGKAKIGIKCVCAENTCTTKPDKQRCDCFTEPEPEVPIDFDILRELIEERKRLEMQNSLRLISENTNKVSGGINVKVRKKPLGEMTLEEAIKYFELHPEEVPAPIEEMDDCICEPEREPEPEPEPIKKPKPLWKIRLSLLNKKRDACDCPEDPPAPEPDEFYPVEPRPRLPSFHPPIPPPVPTLDELMAGEELEPKGFKMVIGGKGSAAPKGLKGICCFDLLQEQSFPRQPKPPAPSDEKPKDEMNI